MQIPTYEPQVRPTISPGPQVRATDYVRDERSASVGPGLAALAHGFNTLAAGEHAETETLLRSQEQQDVTRTGIAVTGVHADITQAFDEDRKAIFNDPSGKIDPNTFNDLVPKYHKMIGDAAEKLVNEATTTKGKDLARSQMAKLYAEHYLPHALTMQATAGTAFALYNINGTVRNASFAVGNDPSTFGSMMSLTEDTINGAPNLDFAHKQTALLHARNEIAWSATNATIRANPSLVAVRSKLPLAQQPALRGVAEDRTGSYPYTPDTPIAGTPIVDNNPKVEGSPAELADMQKTLDSGSPTNVRPVKALPIYRAADGSLRYGKAPEAPAAATAPAEPPSDDEIAKQLPAWSYLTAEHRQTFRNQATTLLNQRGASALTAAQQLRADMNTAAKNWVPAPNPPGHDWYVQNFGENSREEAHDGNMQVAAHVAQYMVAHPDEANLAMAEKLRPLGVGTAGAWEAFNLVEAVARSINKQQAIGLHNDAQAQEARALSGVDPGPAMPKSRFINAGMTAEDHAAYMKDVEAWKTRASLPGMSDELIAAYVGSQQVTGLTPDAIAQERRYTGVLSVAESIAKARKKDPAQFVTDTNSDIRTLYAGAQKSGDPKDWNAYFQASKAEQLRLTGTYSLTSAADRQAITSMLTAPLTDNDGAAARAKHLHDQFGPNFNEVAVEMQRDPKASIPPWFYGTIGTNLPYAQAKAAQLATYDLRELKKDVEASRVTAAHTAMLNELAPMFQSLGVTAGNQTPLAALMEVAEKGMLGDMRSNPNLSGADAAKSNLAPYIDMYKYFPNMGKAQSNQKYMVPNDQDPDKVARGASLVIARMPKLNLEVPPDLSHRYGAGQQRDEWNDDIANRNVWSLNSSGDGLILFAVDRFGTLRKVLTPSGAQLGYSFDALRETADASVTTGHPPSNRPTLRGMVGK